MGPTTWRQFLWTLVNPSSLYIYVYFLWTLVDLSSLYIYVSDIVLKCFPTYLDKQNKRKTVNEAEINRRLSEKLKPSAHWEEKKQQQLFESHNEKTYVLQMSNQNGSWSGLLFLAYRWYYPSTSFCRNLKPLVQPACVRSSQKLQTCFLEMQLIWKVFDGCSFWCQIINLQWIMYVFLKFVIILAA